MSELPSATLVEVPPDLQAVDTAPADVAVYIGCSSKGTLGTPSPFGSQQITTAEAAFGCGPLVREGCYMAGKVPKSFVFLRVPATARAATTSTPVVVKDVSSTWASTLSGTPLDGLDVQIEFTLGGTTGTGPITYKVSTDGGVTFGDPVSLGTGLTIVVSGVTLSLGTGHVVTTGDTIAWWTQAASAAILPKTLTRAASSTSTMTPSGTPNDGYQVLLTFLTGGTIGSIVDPITYSISLDGGVTSKTYSLGTATTILPIDGHGTDASGLTITMGSGTVDAGDVLSFDTVAPVPQWSDVSAALDTLRDWRGTWSFVVVTGYQTRAFRDSLNTKLEAFASSGRFTWGATAGRCAVRGEYTTSKNNVTGDLAWSGRIIAEWGTSVGTRTPPQFGSMWCTCPLTGRRHRRPSTLAEIPRLLGSSPDTDPGDRTIGPLSSDIAIHAPSGELLEHDARVNPSLFNIGGNVLRTWNGEEGIEPGVFCAGGRLMASSIDIQRITYRRVQNLCDAAMLAAMSRNVLMKFEVWGPNTRAPYRAGDIKPWYLKRITQALRIAATNAVGAYVSGGAQGISVVVDPTPTVVAGNTVVTQTTKLVGKQYLDTFTGTVGYTNPALNAFATPAS